METKLPNYISQVFDRKYLTLLEGRASTFRKAFRYLENRQLNYYTILETGSIRDKNGWGSDGASTLLFDEFVGWLGGEVHSVNCNPHECNLAITLTSPRVRIYASESVNKLSQSTLSPDLLYLDSMDLDWNNPHPSALHHLKELTAIYRQLKPGALVMVDDNRNGIGKGMYIREFFETLKIPPLFDEYQIGWIVR